MFEKTFDDGNERQYKVPISLGPFAEMYYTLLGYNVGTDADYSDPDRYYKLIIREDDKILPLPPAL